MALGLAAFPSPAVSGCSSGPGGGDEEDGGGQPGSCERDTSTGPATAVPLTQEDVSGMLCPTGDTDWYAVEIPAGADLLDVDVGFPSSSLVRVDLSAQLFQSDGTTPVAGASVSDTAPDDGDSALVSTLKIPQPGSYLLVVRDSGDDESDAVNYYFARTATGTDPDSHEPNDSVAEASSPDGAPAWIAYEGDLDYYRVNVSAGSGLLRVVLEVPADAEPLAYQVLSPTGTPLSQGYALPGATLDELRSTSGTGEHLIVVSAADGSHPDRRTEAAYTLAVTPLGEPDPNDQGTRNDTPATATCPSGGPASCTAFAGTTLAYPDQGGRIASAGDRDVFRVDVGSGAPAVLEIDAQLAAASPVDLAVDILTPEPGSSCTTDADCTAVNLACGSDRDCELSHSCLPEGAYAFCASGQTCRRCAGASLCVPAGDRTGARVCAMAQYAGHDSTDAGRLRTAQPLLASGPVYVSVHDFQNDAYDYDRSYSLSLRIVPEPDPADQNVAARNNFYDPYPLATSDLSPQRDRALDIDAQITAATSVAGYLSYQGDQDWFSFAHPCPGAHCALLFEWVQPGPSDAHVAFLMYNDGLDLHESWAYTGGTPTSSLSGPVTDVFGDGDCRECSFASSRDTGRYYLQVRDVGMDHWDAGRSYSFRLVSATPGCPTQCSYNPSWDCACYCPDEGACPGVSF